MRREVGTLILGDLQAALDAWDSPPATQYEPVEGGSHLKVRLRDGTWVQAPQLRKIEKGES